MLHVHISNDTLKSYNSYMTSPKATEPFRAKHCVMPHGHSILFLPADIEPGEIAHECMHVVQHITEEIGAQYSDHEFVCYLLGYIVDKVHLFFKKYQEGLDKSIEVLYNEDMNG